MCLQSKRLLWQMYKSLRQIVGSDVFNFMPEHFFDAASLKAAVSSVEQASVFVQKIGEKDVHRARIREAIELLPSAADQQTLADKVAMNAFKRLRLAGSYFDFGVFVAITSISPLRVYVHRNIELRVCEVRHEQQAWLMHTSAHAIALAIGHER